MRAEVTAALAGAAGVSIVTGTVLGLPVAALVAGFGGGVVALGLMPPLAGLVARLSSIASSTITAGFLAPWAAAVAHQQSVDHSIELQAAAFLIGAGAQVLLPAAIGAAKRRIDQIGGQT